MHIAYVDDSGNVGADGSKTFTLGCVMVEASKWPDVFDGLIDFRRFLSSAFRIPIRAELKANWILRNSGPFRELKLSESARHAVYRACMRIQPKLGTMAFAVTIRKDRLRDLGRTDDPRERAWEYLFQRFERFTSTLNTHVLVMHDEGDAAIIRKLARKWRRAGSAGSRFGPESLSRPARRIIDDPVPRRSHESYFIQLADLNAYAAFRRVIPSPVPAEKAIVTERTWDELGGAIYKEVNRTTGGPPGIVEWPR